MKLYVVSDIHLEFSAFDPPKVDCDVVVLAGDTGTKLNGVRWAMEKFPDRPVLYVFGNHEFYGDKWPRLLEKAQTFAAGSNVRVLENEECEISGWRFFGATMWSDFQVTGDLTRSSADAAQSMTDFKRIRHWPTLKRFSPFHARQAHAHTLTSLRAFLASGDRSRSVVVSHHAPSLQSQAPEFLTDPVSGAYVSNLEPLIGELGPALWVHGHIHRPSDYRIEQTRVLANPRGYPGQKGFIDDLVVEL